MANKSFMAKTQGLSKNLKAKLHRFGIYDSNLKSIRISAPLIAQISKNFLNSYNNLISGDELLKLATDKVMDVQRLIGGRFVYLECEDVPELIRFYESNGFVHFGKRELDPDEVGKIRGKYLIQMFKYLHHPLNKHIST